MLDVNQRRPHRRRQLLLVREASALVRASRRSQRTLEGASHRDQYHVEFAFLVDIDNDGKAQEILPEFGDTEAPLAWYEAHDGSIVKHVVSNKSYGHGIGAGDVNGDGRTDILTPKGWFEAPADPRNGRVEVPSGFRPDGLGFMHVMDVNGDGRPDIVTSKAHDYGIFWLEQGAERQMDRAQDRR